MKGKKLQATTINKETKNSSVSRKIYRSYNCTNDVTLLVLTVTNN